MLAKSPITINLLKKDTYKLSLKLDNWELSTLVNENGLSQLKQQINDVLGLTKISETFNCSGEDSEQIKKYWDQSSNRKTCNACKFKWKECHNCIIKSESPLERTLLLELRKQNVDLIMQRRINKDGSYYEFPKEIDFDRILTIPDFYIESEKTKLCVYADGHAYHERTERQALRDRNIDRELQKLGFVVLRYTGQEIRKDCVLVVENICSNLD